MSGQNASSWSHHHALPQVSIPRPFNPESALAAPECWPLPSGGQQICPDLKNPLPMPLLIEPLELVKEALLHSISQDPTLGPTTAAVNCILPPLPVASLQPTDRFLKSNGDADQQLSSNEPISGDFSCQTAKEQSRRRTRKPNKTTKVVDTSNRSESCDGVAQRPDEAEDELKHDKTILERTSNSLEDTTAQDVTKDATVPLSNGQGANMAMDADKSFEEVESKLTEMFAGITSQDSPPRASELPSRRKSTGLAMLVDDAPIETDSDEEEFSLAPQVKKTKGRARSRKKNSTNKTPASTTNRKRKVPGTKKAKGGKNKRSEEVVAAIPLVRKSQKDTEEVRYKGPLLQVRSDGSLSVLNNALGQAEDEQESRNGVKVKKFLHNGGAVVRGLHASTLSMKYDTDRTDTSWVCVFCQLGPHKMGLGDLFGPYMTSIDCDEFRQLDAVDSSSRSRLDMVQSAPHRLPAVPSTVNAAPGKSPINKTGLKKSPKKKPRPTTDTDVAETVLECPSELWMHEDCVLWASGVYMIAGRLVGLEGAVWGSTTSRCVLCKRTGAAVSCLHRTCPERVHVACGRQSNWNLDESLLHSYCQIHHREKQGSSTE